jgi:hypothetical protein
VARPIFAITTIATYAYHISARAQFDTKKTLSLMRRTGLMAGNARIGKPWSAPYFPLSKSKKILILPKKFGYCSQKRFNNFLYPIIGASLYTKHRLPKILERLKLCSHPSISKFLFKIKPFPACYY